MTHYLKWTRKGRIPSYQGGSPLPYQQWTDRMANPILCERGWHACRWEDAIHHIADELWIVDLDGTIIEGDDKVAGERLRLVRRVKTIDERTLRLFAADCAEQVLHLFEKVCPDDDRPRKAIQVARDRANGLADVAAWAAAWDAAWAAARVARDAAGAAGAAGVAGAAAAWDAAWAAAAGAAVGDAAKRWQTERLLAHYAQLNPNDFTHRPATT